MPPKPKELTAARRGFASAGQLAQLVGISMRRLFQPQQRVDGVEVQMGRNLAVPQHEHDLDQSGDARRAFQVSDVGLHRAHQQAAIGVRPSPSTERRASISMGSPKRVPVPWASM